jgi:cytidylate kinase
MHVDPVAQIKRVFVRSRPLDVHRWSDYPELNSCLSALANEIEEREGRDRRRAAQEAKRFKDALRILVLDLVRSLEN